MLDSIHGDCLSPFVCAAAWNGGIWPIGFVAVLQAWMTLMDMGLRPTINREMARLRAGERSPEVIRDLLRSVEVLWVGLACVIVVATWLSAPWLAYAWLKPHGLSQELIVKSIQVIGFVLAVRWLEQIYRGCLLGLQDAVWLNTAQVMLVTLRWVAPTSSCSGSLP